MDKGNLCASHLAWCGLIALNMARLDQQVNSPAQANLFLTRWLATAQKQRRFPKELAGDISWLLREGREKGLSADLPGKLNYLWQASSGNLKDQNDLFRLQYVLHAIKLTGWNYAILTESEWSGRRQLRLSPSVSGIYINRHGLDACFDEHGQQRMVLPARITGELSGLDVLLSRSGWRRIKSAGEDPQLHHLLAESFSGT